MWWFSKNDKAILDLVPESVEKDKQKKQQKLDIIVKQAIEIVKDDFDKLTLKSVKEDWEVNFTDEKWNTIKVKV